jgi:hypothetical protein
MARAVEDVAKVFGVIAGYDAGDPRAKASNACGPAPVLKWPAWDRLPSTFENIEPEIERITRDALDVFRALRTIGRNATRTWKKSTPPARRSFEAKVGAHRELEQRSGNSATTYSLPEAG